MTNLKSTPLTELQVRASMAPLAHPVRSNRSMLIHPDLQDHTAALTHWYAAAAELYRACTEMGRVWTAVGKVKQRADIAAHGAELTKLAPALYEQLHASLNRTVTPAAAGGSHCWAQMVEKQSQLATHQIETVDGQRPPAPPPEPPAPTFRGYAEMLYSGALSSQQAADIYSGASSSACGPRLLVLGSPAIDGACPNPRPCARP